MVKVNLQNIIKKVKNLSYVALSDKNIDDKDWLEKINIHREKAKRLDFN